MLHGVLVIDKPAGMTSAAVVGKVKRALGVKRVGHTGTLDPMATGVLPLCLGEGHQDRRLSPGGGQDLRRRVGARCPRPTRSTPTAR